MTKRANAEQICGYRCRPYRILSIFELAQKLVLRSKIEVFLPNLAMIIA